MKRRQFITLVGSAAAAWPLAVRAQQPERVRRIGAFMDRTADDPEATSYVSAFAQGLQESGWTIGRNVRIDYRWDIGNGDRTDRIRTTASELVGLAPDVILAAGGSIVRGVEQATRTVPIVFVAVTDPVGGGLVASVARPGGNATGFSNLEYGSTGKQLELLKQIAPALTRTAVLRDPTSVGGGGQLGALQSAALSLGVELSPIDTREADEIERAVTAFASTANGGLIVASGAAASIHRELIIMLAARLRLPVVYASRQFVADGGLISYGPDRVDEYRLAASYVDRILKGAKPADLPVQQPTKYELSINLKTATALGLTVPTTLLATADEVIE